MTNDNIVKQTAKELGMTYKELAETIGYSEEILAGLELKINHSTGIR